MKRITTFLTVLAVAAMLLAGCAGTPSPAPEQTTPGITPAPGTTPAPGLTTPGSTPAPSPTAQPPSSGPSTGTLRVLVTDAPGYEVTSVVVHFTEVSVHKAGGGSEGDGGWLPPLEITGGSFHPAENDEPGWIDLAELRDDETKLELAAGDIESGTYTQLRVVMDEDAGVTVTYIPDPEDLDENGDPKEETVNAKLPSGILKFVRPFEVLPADGEEGQSTDILLDFDLQKSVVFTGASQSEDVKVIVKPVVKLSVSEKGGKPAPAQLELEGDYEPAGDAIAEISEDRGYGDSESVHLMTTGDVESGDEARIIVPLPDDTTLGMIDAISWWVWNVGGYDPPSYPPHVDIVMDVDEDGELDDEDMLTAEMAYNNFAGLELDEGLVPTTDEWLQTFELESGDGYGVINDDTMLWVTRMGAGNDDAPYGTLADWKGGIVAEDPQPDGLADGIITGEAPVLRLEIEIDNWVRQSEAYVDDIVVVIDGDSYTVVFDMD